MLLFSVYSLLHLLFVRLYFVKAASSHPNIIFILADDAGYNDFGWAKDDYLGLTENLDALKDESIEITQFYTQQECTPARAALLTGRYPFKMGMQDDSISFRDIWGLPIQYSILPQYLADYGYESHAIGKWHLGHAYEKYMPHHRGFTSFYGFLSSQVTYRTHESISNTPYMDFIELWSDDDTYHNDHTGNRAEAGQKCVENKEGKYSSKLYTDRALKMAYEWKYNGGKDDDIPLFFYVAYQNPHYPLEPDETMDYSSVLDVLENIDSSTRLMNAKLMFNLDSEVKRLVTGLKELDVLDNYILVFASDNGPCKNSGGSSYPLRGWKFYTFEGGSRTRAFIQSSLFTEKDDKAQYNQIFHISDWLPTLMDAVDPGWSVAHASENLDGVSHWRAFMTNDYDLNPRKEIVYNLKKSNYHNEEGTFLIGAIRVGNWKLVLNEMCQLWLDFSNRYSAAEYLSQCKDKSYQCVVSSDQRTYLFNIADDPYEVNDLKYENHDHFNALMQRAKEYENEILNPISLLGYNELPEFKKAYHDAGCIVPWID